MALKSDNIFVNLPVKNLEKTKDFFSKIGFEFNAQFTDKNAACLVIGDNIFAMLLTEDYFKTFTKKDLSNAANTTEVILALSAESREQVDEIVNAALSAGGSPSNDPVDHGFMYGWSFQDP
ncbi:glyoxalase/bleomycin resistance/extradiol dioxygenase family protein, partial [Clostridium perfringens]